MQTGSAVQGLDGEERRTKEELEGDAGKGEVLFLLHFVLNAGSIKHI